MKLYIGGICQGQTELARAENPGAELYADMHLAVRAACENGEDPREFARRFCAEHPGAVVSADEVGSGVVPVSAEDRAYRENVGRALCVIASNAESVTRVVCGLPVRIK